MSRISRILLFYACLLGVAIALPAACAAEAIDVTGTGWVSRDKNGVTRLMEFRKDGTFVDMTDQHIYTGIWKHEKGRVGAAVKYREYATSAGVEGVEYIMYLADVVDGKLKGMSAHYDGRKKLWEYPFHLERETTCAGERGICGNRLYCIDPATRKSITRMPYLDDRPSVAGRIPEKPEDFLSEFFCAARLNITGSLALRVRLPLTYVKIENTHSIEQGNRLQDKQYTRMQVEAPGFRGLMLWPVEREKESASMRRQTFDSAPSRDSHGVHQFLLPPFPPRAGRSVLSPWPGGDTLWHFTQESGAWYLDEVWECRGGDSCPEALYCGEGYPKSSFPAAAAGKGEDFFEFFHTFYCAMYARNENLVFSRIKYPLPYDELTTEGGYKGKFKGPEKSQSIELYACDGYPLPPALSVNGDKAEASIPRDGTGCGKGLSFRRINGLWYLVHARFDSY